MHKYGRKSVTDTTTAINSHTVSSKTQSDRGGVLRRHTAHNIDRETDVSVCPKIEEK